MRHHVQQKKSNLLFICLAVTYLFIFTACVSVKLGNEDVAKSKKIDFTPPSQPFTDVSLKNADRSWQNPSTGTTLSYLSICNDTSDPSVESIRDTTLHGLENSKIEKEELIPYNAREALKSDISGQLDGVKVRVKLLIFKKNFCNYTISMVAIQNKMSTDSEVFENFIKGFKAQ